ncbi:MAG: hypothetical protein FWE45_01100 [Firmicutes bacterium]|nr:hypothetical protein [Bacillota bacterium]
MSRAARTVSAYVAGAILGIFLVVFGIFALIFWFPRDLTFLGMGNVNQRESFTRYGCADVREVLDSRNIIVNSSRTDIMIRATNPGQADEGTIVIYEDARGITFNGNHRTHISWTQTLTPEREVFYQINVHEPSGMVQRRALVTINIISDGSAPLPFNFIFNTGTANVTFAGDSPADFLLVESVVINPGSVGIFTFPQPANPSIGRNFEMELQNLVVHASPATVRAPDGVTQSVIIHGNHGNYTFGEVGTLYVPNSTSVNITTREIHGSVHINSRGGTMNLGIVNSSVTMTATTGRLNASRISGNVDFTTTSTGSVNVTEIIGTLDVETNAGSVNVRSVHGNVNINSRRAPIHLGTGTGSSPVPGMRGNVTINNTYGVTNVYFMNGIIGAPSLDFVGFDGNINARNIVGRTNILIESGGRAQVSAGFRRVQGNQNEIRYIGSTDPRSNFGNVRVILQGPLNANPAFNAFNFNVSDSRSARDFTGWFVPGRPNPPSNATQHGVEIPNINAPGGAPWPVMGGSGANVLNVFTTNVVRLEWGR